MDKLMMMLDKKKLEALEEEFSQHPDGIKLGNFVWLMKAAVNHTEEEKFDLVYGLQKLFAEIDINGDEHMEWTEFTQYIIDAVIQNPSIKGSGGKNRDLLQETKMMKYRKYFPSKFKDKSSHNSWIKNVVWCQKFQSLLVIENNQKQIKLLNPYDLTQKMIINLPPSKKEIYIADIDYSNEHVMFGCIDSDCNMIFWDYFINLKICKTLKSPCLQYKIRYLKNHKTWVTMGQDNGHKDLILDLIELTTPFAIASASLDSTIRIYSLVDKEEISVLREHVKGVKQLSYNPNFGGFILSVGFERNVNVWSPEVTQKKSLIGRLEGQIIFRFKNTNSHTEIVVCAKFLNFKPFCVSIDEKFNFRFWDVRTLTCVQVITNEINSQVPIYGMYMYPPQSEQERFAILSKRLLFYDTKKKEPQQQDNAKGANDQVNPIRAEFNRYYLNFSIVTPHDIRIYNAKDGKLQKIIQNIVDPKTRSPITSFCMDDRQRKFYVGDSAGGIRTYNISNGVFIKTVQHPFQKNVQKTFELVNEMDSHEISSLQYINMENHNVQLLVTSSWDSSLQIYDEGEQPDESHVLRVAVGGHGKEDISCMSIWDFESNKVENYCLEHSKSISSLYFMYPLSVLVSSCNDGYVCFWGLKQAPLDYRYKLLKKQSIFYVQLIIIRIANNLEDPEACLMKVNITCAKTKYVKVYEKDNPIKSSILPIMLIGDDNGFVNQWDLTPVIKEFREQKGFKDVLSISKYQLSFNPKKNAQVNSLSAAKTLIFFAQPILKHHSTTYSEQKQKKFEVTHSTGFVKRAQWFAHHAQLNSINFLENPDGVLTCSADRHVKLWSLDGELWGDINLLKENCDKKWIYPFDWSEKKAKEIEKVKKLMAIVSPNPDKNVEEQIVFEQMQKKEKDKREIIDYLAKRQRRMDLEQNLKRQHERQVMLQNQEQMRVQYVSQQMKYSENVCIDKYKQDMDRMQEESYHGLLNKYPVLQVMDQRFKGLIEASLNGEKIKDILSHNQENFNRQQTTGKSIRMRKSDSTTNLQVGSNTPNTPKKTIKVSYPKPIINKKDKNKEFNHSMFHKLAGNKSMQQLLQMNQIQPQLVAGQFERDLIQSRQSNQSQKQLSETKSLTNKVTFNDQSALQNTQKFEFYNPQQQQKTSTALNYTSKLKVFTPLQKQSTPTNLKGALQSMRNTLTSAILMSPSNNQQNQKDKNMIYRNQSSQNISQFETRPFTVSQSQAQISTLQSIMKDKFLPEKDKNTERIQGSALAVGLSSPHSFNSPLDLAVKSSKLAQSQRRQSMKITALANQVKATAENLEYQIRKDYLRQKEFENQQSISQAASQQDVKSQVSSPQQPQKTKTHAKSLKTLASPKQRRCIIGFEGGTSHSSAQFLKKLNNFISQSNGPQSQISERMPNIRYAKGEGMRLLKIKYNDVQFDNRVLHTDEYGYKRKEPDPHLYNIFKDRNDHEL